MLSILDRLYQEFFNSLVGAIRELAKSINDLSSTIGGREIRQSIDKLKAASTELMKAIQENNKP